MTRSIMSGPHAASSTKPNQPESNTSQPDFGAPAVGIASVGTGAGQPGIGGDEVECGQARDRAAARLVGLVAEHRSVQIHSTRFPSLLCGFRPDAVVHLSVLDGDETDVRGRSRTRATETTSETAPVAPGAAELVRYQCGEVAPHQVRTPCDAPEGSGGRDSRDATHALDPAAHQFGAGQDFGGARATPVLANRASSDRRRSAHL
jgi:hypothetical protein